MTSARFAGRTHEKYRPIPAAIRVLVNYEQGNNSDLRSAVVSWGMFMMKMLFIIAFATFVSGSSHALTTLEGGAGLDDSVTVDGTMSAHASAGEYMTNAGKEIEPSEKQLEAESAQVKDYDGPAEFKASYVINQRKNGNFKSGSVTLQTSDFNWNPDGAPKVESPASFFTTDKIKITAAKISNGKVEVFKFKAANWYPETEPGGDTIIDKGMKGKINFVKGTSKFEAAYKHESDASIDTFKMNGDIVALAPAVPEISTWAMMLLGFAGLGLIGYRASRKSPAFGA